MSDTTIMGGALVDGTGADVVDADIGIDEGKIVAVESPGVLSVGRKAVDASGKIVTPGFIDPHTHMDAQLWWDSSGSPSVRHGITSVVLGSCGFGVAPAGNGTEDYLLRSLEAVEEIPYSSIRQAVPMRWGPWREYFEMLDELPLGISVASFAPHLPLRIATLGDRGRAADLDPAELLQLVGALEEALAFGAVGLSSSRGYNHTDAYGDPVPTRLATDEELEGLVRACAGRIWQVNIAAKATTDEAGVRAGLEELESYAQWSRQHDARLTWTPLVAAPGDQVAWRRPLEYSREQAPWLLPQVSPQPMSASIRFDGPSFAGIIDGWSRRFAGYSDLNRLQMIARLSDPEVRREMRNAKEDCARTTSPCYQRWVVMVAPSDPSAVGLSLADLGERSGHHPVDTLSGPVDRR